MPIGRPPQELTPLHLFRALLRECSYLPDPVAKEYFKDYTISRFRRYHAPQPSQAPFTAERLDRLGGAKQNESHESLQPRAPESPPSSERHVHLLHTARNKLGTLSRANNGRPKALYKVLSYAYGRSGKRRRYLMHQLQPPNTTATDSGPTNAGSDAKIPRLTPLAEAIARSQVSQGITRDHKSLLKHSKPRIPEKNSWMRAMPQVRVKNLTAKWYARTLDRLLPPLPERDYRLLHGLANREHPWSAPAYRSAPKDAVESKPEFHRGKETKRNLAIPRRKMERLWSRVLAQCPDLTWKEDKSTWSVSWPVVDKTHRTVPLVEKSARLFGGVDEMGNIIQPRVSRPALENEVE